MISVNEHAVGFVRSRVSSKSKMIEVNSQINTKIQKITQLGTKYQVKLMYVYQYSRVYVPHKTNKEYSNVTKQNHLPILTSLASMYP